MDLYNKIKNTCIFKLRTEGFLKKKKIHLSSQVTLYESIILFAWINLFSKLSFQYSEHLLQYMRSQNHRPL